MDVKKLFKRKLEKLSRDSDIFAKPEDLKIHCPVCGQELKEDRLQGVEYIKTKRQSEIFIHTKCVNKWGKS